MGTPKWGKNTNKVGTKRGKTGNKVGTKPTFPLCSHSCPTLGFLFQPFSYSLLILGHCLPTMFPLCGFLFPLCFQSLPHFVFLFPLCFQFVPILAQFEVLVLTLGFLFPLYTHACGLVRTLFRLFPILAPLWGSCFRFVLTLFPLCSHFVPILPSLWSSYSHFLPTFSHSCPTLNFLFPLCSHFAPILASRFPILAPL